MGRKLLKITLVLAAAFAIEALGLWLGESAAAWAIVLAHLILLFFAGLVGRVLLLGRPLVAVLVGLALGAGFWLASWRFIGWLMVDAFQRDTDSGFVQFSGPYSLYLPPTLLLSGLFAGLGSVERKTPRARE